MTQAPASRRQALFGLFAAAAGGALSFAPGVAEACRYLPWSRRRPQLIEEADVVAFVRVVSIRHRKSSRGGAEAIARARIVRLQKGKARLGEMISYKVSWFDCTGDKLGYIPPVNGQEVLYLARSGSGWTVNAYEPLFTFRSGGEPPKVGYR